MELKLTYSKILMLFYILLNSSWEIVLESVLMILLGISSSITSLSPFSLLFNDLLLFVSSGGTYSPFSLPFCDLSLFVAEEISFLQFDQPGGGCLIGTWDCTFAQYRCGIGSHSNLILHHLLMEVAFVWVLKY